MRLILIKRGHRLALRMKDNQARAGPVRAACADILTSGVANRGQILMAYPVPTKMEDGIRSSGEKRGWRARVT